MSMQKKFLIRDLQKEDIQTIHTLAKKSWKFAYKDIYSDDFIEKHFTTAYSASSLEKNLAKVKEGFSRFIVLKEIDPNKILGFAQIGYDNYWITGKKELPLRLFRIYLDPDEIGKGLGKILLQEVEKFVIQESQTSYIVGVHEKNKLGLRFYEKMGFNSITKESEVDGEIFFKKDL